MQKYPGCEKMSSPAESWPRERISRNPGPSPAHDCARPSPEREARFRISRTQQERTIIVNAPAGGMTSSGNNEISRQLGNWWIQHRQGRVFDSSGGFFLTDGSVLNPDAAYATAEQLSGLTREELARFLRLCPAFVVELRSESDRRAAVQEMMEAWIVNGAELAWLIDPGAKQVHVYRRGIAPGIETASQVSGSGPIEGFVLDLEEVWRCYQ
jgi:Uma2 family endonuclease